MKLLTHYEVLISLSLFLGTFTLISLLFFNLQSSDITSLREERNVIKTLAISHILIYSNFSDFSLSTNNYTLLSQQKVSNFFSFCNSNKEFIKNFFNVSDFNIRLNCSNNIFECRTKNIQTKITRVATMNNMICYLYVGVE